MSSTGRACPVQARILRNDGTPRETVVGLFKVYNDQAPPERKLGPAEINDLVDAAQLELCPDTID